MEPLILAHRGASHARPENTMEAFEEALKQGADGVELDIFLTRDHEIIITHDDDMQRLAGNPLKTRQATLQQLNSLPFKDDTRIPSLQEFLHAFGNRFSVINIEIKSTGLFSDGIEEALNTLLLQMKPKAFIVISSFNPMHLWRIKRINNTLETGFLYCKDNHFVHSPLIAQYLQARNLHFDVNWISPQIWQKYAPLKKKTWLWTLDSKSDREKVSYLDIEAIITNEPGIWKKKKKS